MRVYHNEERVHIMGKFIDIFLINVYNICIDVNQYNAESRYIGVNNFKIDHREINALGCPTQPQNPQEANKFYSDLYYFSRMNDYTEMVKELISQNKPMILSVYTYKQSDMINLMATTCGFATDTPIEKPEQSGVGFYHYHPGDAFFVLVPIEKGSKKYRPHAFFSELDFTTWIKYR